jgi:hypothetical protein
MHHHLRILRPECDSLRPEGIIDPIAFAYQMVVDGLSKPMVDELEPVHQVDLEGWRD